MKMPKSYGQKAYERTKASIAGDARRARDKAFKDGYNAGRAAEKYAKRKAEPPEDNTPLLTMTYDNGVWRLPS